MAQLKVLDLRDNQINEIPEQIAMLQHVIRLDLTNNELSSLPNGLGLLPHLQNLQIEGNALKQIRMDIIKGGTCRILKFLRERMEDVGVEKVNSATGFQDKQIFPNKYQMRTLKALNAPQKELSVVPDEVFEDGKNAEVHMVDLSKNKLVAFPNG